MAHTRTRKSPALASCQERSAPFHPLGSIFHVLNGRLDTAESGGILT